MASCAARPATAASTRASGRGRTRPGIPAGTGPATRPRLRLGYGPHGQVAASRVSARYRRSLRSAALLRSATGAQTSSRSGSVAPVVRIPVLLCGHQRKRHKQDSYFTSVTDGPSKRRGQTSRQPPRTQALALPQKQTTTLLSFQTPSGRQMLQGQRRLHTAVER